MSSITYVELYGDWTAKRASGKSDDVTLELRDRSGGIIANTTITKQVAQTLALDLLDALNLDEGLYEQVAKEFDR